MLLFIGKGFVYVLLLLSLMGLVGILVAMMDHWTFLGQGHGYGHLKYLKDIFPWSD